MKNLRFVVIPIGFICFGCLDTEVPSDAKVPYRLEYDVTGKEMNVPFACHHAVVILQDQPALDRFISEWTSKDDGFNLPGFDFSSRQVLGVVMQRSRNWPAAIKVKAFLETDDSLKLELEAGCPGCIHDSPSGDAVVLTYPKIAKPLAVIFNGSPKALEDSVRRFEAIPECFGED